MQRRRLLSFGLAAAAIVFAGGTAWAALTSSSFRLANSTLQGGLSGSGVSSNSATYSLRAVTFGGTTSVLSSTTYRLCTGFACANPIYGVNLTSLQK